MGILAGKRILVTGVITDASIAFHVARVAQQEGASVVLTGFGRLSLVERIARRLPDPPPVLELDVRDPGQLDSLAGRVREHADGLDGVVHAIGNAPQDALGGNFLNTSWDDVAAAIQVSPEESQPMSRTRSRPSTNACAPPAGMRRKAPTCASTAIGCTSSSPTSSCSGSRWIARTT